jgi:formamidopyrimidine-DNA glycosylase
LHKEAAMLDLPEMMTLARQMRERLTGRRIASVEVADERPKWLWLAAEPQEHAPRMVGKRLGPATADGHWLRLPLEPGEALLLGDFGGRVLLHPPGAKLPKWHLRIGLDDGSTLTITVQGWGFVTLLSEAEEAAFAFYQGRGISPLDPRFTREHLAEVMRTAEAYVRKPIKAFLVHDPNVAGIGNGMLQDILFRARLHPRQRVCDLGEAEVDRLYDALREIMNLAVAEGGRDTERGLDGEPGGYTPLMDRRAAGKPCPRCGTPIQKISYLGGSCYFCPQCQPWDG